MAEVQVECVERSLSINGSEDAKNGVIQVVENVRSDGQYVVFVDPTGTRWTFPYEAAKTWKDAKDLIKLVYVDCLLPDRYGPLLDQEDSQSFAIIRLNSQQSHVLPQHWDTLVSPKWEFKIEFYGAADVLEEIRKARNEQQSVKDHQGEYKEDTNEEEGTKERDSKTSRILYVAQYLLPDEDGDLKFDSEEKFQDKPTVAVEGGELSVPESSVLEEFREFSCKDRHSALPLRERAIYSGPPRLHVVSQTLLNALKAVITFQSPADSIESREYNYGKIETSLDRGRFVYPFTDLYHYRDRLAEYREEVKLSHDSVYSETCREHIDILLEYLDDQATTILQGIPQMLRHPTPQITFRHLWYLFKAGSDVYVRQKGKLDAYVVESSENANDFSWNLPEAFPTPFTVNVWNLNFDGRHLTRSVTEVRIPVFDGQREIKSLPVFPVQFHGDDSLRQELIDRGRKFVAMVKEPALREYSGPSELQGIREYHRARVVIDHTTEPWTRGDLNKYSPGDTYEPVTTVYGVDLGEHTRMPKCPCQTCEAKEAHEQGLQRRMFDDYDEIDLQRKTTLTDHQYLLCASHVYGFVLKDRIWDVLEVKLLEHPRIQANIIDMLVMKPESNKHMIKAICEIYGGVYTQTFSSDFIQGKGEGQILLLHGPPGTGKTLTAESVAEYTARPLLSITAADLGHEPDTLEKNLLRFFRDAKKWNAIVLLDEADVYLETRGSHDLQRNSIVSIFLRALDYFQGILFLTTNRVGRFDEAFMSRIHVQIGYDPLDEGSRQQIWDNHFKKLSRNHETHGHEMRVSYDAKEFVRKSKDLRALKWNGREIRNAFQTALALASFQAKQEGNAVPELTDEHLMQVVNMSQNFKNYLQNVRGDEELVALQQGVRNDDIRASGAP